MWVDRVHWCAVVLTVFCCPTAGCVASRRGLRRLHRPVVLLWPQQLHSVLDALMHCTVGCGKSGVKICLLLRLRAWLNIYQCKNIVERLSGRSVAFVSLEGSFPPCVSRQRLSCYSCRYLCNVTDVFIIIIIIIIFINCNWVVTRGSGYFTCTQIWKKSN